MSTQSNKTILIAGGSSAAGVATAKALLGAGHRVVAVGSSEARITTAAAASGATARVADLANPTAVTALHEWINNEFGALDGLIHLVGGWRGGGGLAEQNDADWDFLSHGVIDTLRITSREFSTELAGNSGRLAIVSSTSLAHPTAANANYVAAKAAAEAWTLAAAEGFTKQAESDPSQQAAAIVFRVKALLTDEMKAAQPERRFPGYTHVDQLATRVAALFDQAAEEINGSIVDLTAS